MPNPLKTDSVNKLYKKTPINPTPIAVKLPEKMFQKFCLSKRFPYKSPNKITMKSPQFLPIINSFLPHK